MLRHFIDTEDFSKQELLNIIELIQRIKAADRQGCTPKLLADAYLAKAVQKYQHSASRLSEWLAANIPEGLTVFSFPGAFRRLLRTTNGVERWRHGAMRCRARVVSIFPNQASCLRLVSAVFNEISEEWLTGRTYVTFESSS